MPTSAIDSLDLPRHFRLGRDARHLVGPVPHPEIPRLGERGQTGVWTGFVSGGLPGFHAELAPKYLCQAQSSEDRVHGYGGDWCDSRWLRASDFQHAHISPDAVHGQTHGGIAQGVGEAMWEECVVDPASGQPLSGSFMDYGMPRSNSLPFFTTRIVEVLSPTNPFGIKAGGEGGCTPALAVVISAILDALAPLGVRDMTMPAAPFKVWTAIQNARRQSP